MHLLLVTDHRFQQTKQGVFDRYCFGYSFFADYLDVFERVTVAARLAEGTPEGERSDGPGIEFMALPDRRGPGWLLSSLASHRRLATAIAAADAVCLRIPSLAALATLRSIDAQDVPVMFEMIGDPAEAVRGSPGLSGTAGAALGSWIARQVIRRAKVGSYVSRQHLQRRYPARPDVLTDSISSIRLPGSQIRAPKVFAAAPAPLRAILVASFMPVKAHDVLLRGIATARNQGANVCITLVGDGPCRAACEQLAQELGIRDAVTFLGHVSERERVFELLDRHDLFVMSSLSEGMPRAMIEAMARGLPAIGSNVPGIAELLPSHQRFAVGRHDEIANLIVELARSPQLLTEAAARSHAIARQFEQETLSARRRRLLEELRTHAISKRKGAS